MYKLILNSKNIYFESKYCSFKNINVLLLKYLKNSFCIGSATALPALAPKQNPSAIRNMDLEQVKMLI